MTEVELAQNALLVHVRGMDQLWALKSRLEIPDPAWSAPKWIRKFAVGWKDLRVPGIHVPGVITAGSFYQEASAYSGTCTTRRRPL